MTGLYSGWALKGLFFHRYDKSSEITGVCKGKCFCIRTSLENFDRSPKSLETYIRLMDGICDDEDMEKALLAEEDLYKWIVQPFLPIFDKMEPSSRLKRPLTLQNYLNSETHRFVLYVVEEQRELCFDYDVPGEPRPCGVDLHDWTVPPEWKVFNPSEIQLCGSQDENELLSQVPYKVVADGELRFHKLFDHGHKACAIREMEIYQRRETLRANERLRVPRLYGIVQDEKNARLLGLILSWIDCENTTLACALSHETPLALRLKWDQQVSTALACLHKVGIIWGDAKAGNVLIDKDDNAWVVDFGGGYTRGWVGKDRMETIEGDQEGLFRIKELLHQGSQDI